MGLSRRGFLTGAASLAATSLTGCGGGSGVPGAASATAPPAEPPTEPVTIDWLVPELLDDDGNDLRRTLVRAFEQRFDTISVRMTEVPPTTDVRRTTLTTQIASGATRPDVYLGDCAWPAQFAHNSLAMPLGEVAADGEFWSRYRDEVVQAVSYRGQAWAYPCYLDTSFLFYRADLLRKHGIRPPDTWEELGRAASRLVDSGDVRYGFVWQGESSEALTCNIAEFVGDAGGALMDGAAQEVLVDSRAGSRAVEFMAGLVSSGVSPAAVGTFAEEQSQTAFTGGQAAFLRNWSYAWGGANDPAASSVAGKIGVMPRPAFDGTGPARRSALGGWHNLVNPHTSHAGAAVTFARWVAGEEAQTLMATTSPYLPALTSVMEDPTVTGQKAKPIMRYVADQELVLRPFRSPRYPAISKAMYTNVNRLLVGGGDTSQVGSVLHEMAAGMARGRDGAAL